MITRGERGMGKIAFDEDDRLTSTGEREGGRTCVKYRVFAAKSFVWPFFLSLSLWKMGFFHSL